MIPSGQAATKVIGVAIAAIIAMAILLTVTGSGLAPGMAESKVEGDSVVITFERGDRYFWVPADLDSRVDASSIVAGIEGSQTIIKRSSHTGGERLAYSEEKGGPDDFAILKDTLYEINGVYETVQLSYLARGPADGQDFTQELKDGSAGFLKRVGSLVMSSPLVIWDSLKDIGNDVRGLFHVADPTATGVDGQDGGAVQFTKYLAVNWGVLVTIGVLILLLPLLGFDNLLTGFIAGGILAAGGQWPMALVAVAAGWFLDDNQAPDGPSRWGLKYWAHASQNSAANATQDYPKVVGGVLFFTMGLGGAAVAAWLHHPNIAVLSAMAGLACGVYLIFSGARSHSGRVAYHRIGAVPAIAMVAMGLATSAILVHFGYSGFAAASGFLALVFAVTYVNWAWRVKQARDLAQDGGFVVRGKIYYNAYNERRGARAARRKAIEGMSLWGRGRVLMAAVVGFISLAAILNGDWLAGLALVVMFLPVFLWAFTQVPMRWINVGREIRFKQAQKRAQKKHLLVEE